MDKTTAQTFASMQKAMDDIWTQAVIPSLMNMGTAFFDKPVPMHRLTEQPRYVTDADMSWCHPMFRNNGIRSVACIVNGSVAAWAQQHALRIKQRGYAETVHWANF